MKKLIAVAAVVAMVGMASTAMAAATDRLTVKDSNGNAVFKVDDAGTFQVPGLFKFDTTSKFVGIGTDTPVAAFHLNYKTAAAPFQLERELDNNGAVSMMADNYGGTGFGAGTGAGMLFRFSKGNKGLPGAVAVGDRLGFLVFGGHTGSAIAHTAAINALVDAGTVSGTSLPTYLQFLTTADGSTTRTERFRIAGDGRIRLSNQPAVPVSGSTACVAGDMILAAATGKLYLCTAAPSTWKSVTFQ